MESELTLTPASGEVESRLGRLGSPGAGEGGRAETRSIDRAFATTSVTTTLIDCINW